MTFFITAALALICLAAIAGWTMAALRWDRQTREQRETAERVRSELQRRNDELTMSLVAAHGGTVTFERPIGPLRSGPGWFDRKESRPPIVVNQDAKERAKS